MTTNRPHRRRAALALLALTLLALGGCGRHLRPELRESGGEPALTTPDGRPATPPIVNRESPTVQRWAGGD